MINMSRKYRNAVQGKDRKFIARATINLVDQTVLNITAENIMVGGVQIEDSTSQPDSFEIGSAVINKLTLQLDNADKKYSTYNFSGAQIKPEIGFLFSDGSVEWMKKGVFNVDKATTPGTIVKLECLDRMAWFEEAYNTDLSYPNTLGSIVYDACVKCGVPIKTTTFFNSNYVVKEKPTAEMNYREVIAYCAQLAGCFARMDNEGKLELKWYESNAFSNLDGGNFEKYELENQVDGGNFSDYGQTEIIDGGDFEELSKYHHIYAYNSLEINTDDIVITGVKIAKTEEEQKEEYLYGEEGYVLVIENNPFAQGNLSELVRSIGSKVAGMTFRPLNIQALSDPSIEAGDAAIVSDRYGNSYECFLTNLSYTIGEYETFSCDAQTESEQKSTRYTPYTKIERKIATEVNQKLNGFEQQFSQFNELMANAMGFYSTIEKQEDGSSIAYLHNKPQLADSETIWKISVDGFGVSLDGGKTWTTGITKDGNIIANILSVVGINANWINVGELNAINIKGSLIEGSQFISKAGDVSGQGGNTGDYTQIVNGFLYTNRVVLGNGGLLQPGYMVISGSNNSFTFNADTGQMICTGDIVCKGDILTNQGDIAVATINGRPVVTDLTLINYATRESLNEQVSGLGNMITAITDANNIRFSNIEARLSAGGL